LFRTRVEKRQPLHSVCGIGLPAMRLRQPTTRKRQGRYYCEREAIKQSFHIYLLRFQFQVVIQT